MANTNLKRGLVPVKYLNGVAWNGQVNIYHHDSGDGVRLGLGDPVKSAGGSDTSGVYPNVVRAAAGETILGVVVGFGTLPTGILGMAQAVLYDPDSLTKCYGVASTSYYVAVVDDPNVVFEIQEDSDGGALAAANVGQNIDILAADCSTSTGLSQFQLDSSSLVAASATTGTFRLLNKVDRMDNAIGNYCKWHVMVNLHERRASLASV